jgi:hypothetical protein
MRAELYRPPPAEGASETVVAAATWKDGRASIEVLDPGASGLESIVRPTPVVVDDPSLRAQGTRGDVLLQPGDRDWFVAAVRARGHALGLSVRFVAEPGPGGWDPASQYRRFDQQIDKLARERS